MHWRFGIAEDPAEGHTPRGFTNGSPAELDAGPIDDVVLPQAMLIVREHVAPAPSACRPSAASLELRVGPRRRH
jgi:hypothetical protein